MSCKPKELLYDFVQAAKLAGIAISETDISAEELPAPHSPPSSLPRGKIAVYVFSWRNECLKVGKVGPRSQARYTSQHYSPGSSNSNLAKSILKEKKELGLADLDKTKIGNWIRKNTDRINFIVDASLGIPTLTLLEAFLQCRLKPKFEGFDSQN